MAATTIISDATKELCRRRDQLLRNLRNNAAELESIVKAMESMRDGADNAGDPSNYDLLTAAGGYVAGDYATAHAAARISFKELEAVFGHVVTNGGAAIKQACALHGVI